MRTYPTLRLLKTSRKSVVEGRGAAAGRQPGAGLSPEEREELKCRVPRWVCRLPLPREDAMNARIIKTPLFSIAQQKKK
jgi:hypothetical protein